MGCLSDLVWEMGSCLYAMQTNKQTTTTKHARARAHARTHGEIFPGHVHTSKISTEHKDVAVFLLNRTGCICLFVHPQLIMVRWQLKEYFLFSCAYANACGARVNQPWGFCNYWPTREFEILSKIVMCKLKKYSTNKCHKQIETIVCHWTLI